MNNESFENPEENMTTLLANVVILTEENNRLRRKLAKAKQTLEILANNPMGNCMLARNTLFEIR